MYYEVSIIDPFYGYKKGTSGGLALSLVGHHRPSAEQSSGLFLPPATEFFALCSRSCRLLGGTLPFLSSPPCSDTDPRGLSGSLGDELICVDTQHVTWDAFYSPFSGVTTRENPHTQADSHFPIRNMSTPCSERQKLKSIICGDKSSFADWKRNDYFERTRGYPESPLFCFLTSASYWKISCL